MNRKGLDMKIRLTIWTIVISVIALFFYQNREFYLGEQTLSLNLFFTQWDSPPVAHATQVLIAFLAGLLLASISLYHERFKMRRQLKKLTIAFQSCAQQVTDKAAAECTVSRNKRFKLPVLLRKKEAAGNRIDSDEVAPAPPNETTEPAP